MADTVGKTPGTRELWLLPRDHFKTTILTIGHGIQQILRNPSQALLLVSRKDDHALVWSDEMRRQFATNTRLQVLFPEWCVRVKDDLGSVSEWVNPAYKVIGGFRRREPTVTVASMKGRKQSRHYNWVYPDDCMDKEDASEVGLREIREDWKEIIPLVDKDGGIVACGTRKHYTDLYQSIMATKIYKVYARHGLESPTIRCSETGCSEFAQPHNAPDYSTGIPIEPRRMDRKDFESKLAECRVDPKMGESFFWHEYMNIPQSPSDQHYQPAWFKRIDEDMIPGGSIPFHPLRRYISVDTALKLEEHPTGTDYTVAIPAGFDDAARLYIFDILRDRKWTAKQFCEAMVTIMRAYSIDHVIYQKVGEVTWPGDLREACRRANIPLVMIPLTRGGRNALKKSEWIRQSQGAFENGRVFFRKGADYFQECVDEHCNLGRWTNDDIADAIANLFDEKVRPLSQMPGAGKWKSPVRPMASEGAWRMAAFSIANDPLGRNGADGPAEITSDLKDESLTGWAHAAIGGRH